MKILTLLKIGSTMPKYYKIRCLWKLVLCQPIPVSLNTRMWKIIWLGRNCFMFYPFELPHDKTNKMTCEPSEDSDQPGHPPSLIRVFAVRMKKHWVLSDPLSAQQRLWSDWADAQADLSLHWMHIPFCWFCHAVAQMCMPSFSEGPEMWVFVWNFL